MAEMNTIVEGKVKYREGKKWKPRWCVMKKPSPVADRLQVLLYKDVKDSVKGGSPKSNFPLDGFYGLESGICYDKETSVLAIICQKQITLLAYESRETLIQFEIKIRRSLGEEHQFPVRTVKVPNQSKLPLDLVRLHIQGQKFCLTAHIPPKILGSWQVSELRRFGTIDGKFCFEGGSRCGKGQGFHVLQTDQSEEISEIISHANSGKAAPLIKRQTSKRRSELLEPMKNVVGDNLFKKFQNSPIYLDQSYLDESNTSRPKRHSISFTDYKRAKTYAEKQKLQSIENVEKERLMALYDIPPRRIRKVETVQQQNYENAIPSPVRNFDVNLDNLRNFANGQCLPANENYLNWTGEFNNNVMSYQVPPTTTSSSNQSDTSSEQGSVQGSVLSLQSIPTPQGSVECMPMSSSVPVLSGYSGQGLVNKYREYSQSVPSHIAEEMDRVAGGERLGAGEGKREDALQSLQQTEQDLEKEMSLLDEMLQVCQREQGRRHDDDRSYEDPPPLPVKLSSVHGKSARGSLDNLSIQSDNTHCRPLPKGGYSSSGLLSPNLVYKLKKIPRKSKLSAPLPYVNLDKYDVGDIDTNHVHIPASSTSAPDGRGSWTDLQKARSKGYDNVKEEKGSNKENKRISVSLPGSRENLRNISGSDLHLNIKSKNMCYSNEPIYSNQRCETPPPELPPKGPGLASKSRRGRMSSAASRPPPPPRPPDRHSLHHARQQDKYRVQYQTPRTIARKCTAPEEDYFLMGNFEKEPTHCRIDYSESQRLNESLAGRTFVTLPPRGHNTGKISSDPTSCYMDMTVPLELERSRSFNESNCVTPDGSSSSHRPRYSRSLSDSGGFMRVPDSPQPQRPPRPESISVSAGNSPREPRREPPIREQNYMLMSSVSPKRSVVDAIDPPQEYESRTASEIQDTLEDTIQKCLNFSTDNLNTCIKNGDLFFLDDTIKDEEDGGEYVVVVDDSPKVEMPFDNLLNFTLPLEQAKTTKSVQLNVSSDKIGTETSSGKTPGFLKRFIRRNSKDRKNVSQSHENLLASEPAIKESMAVVEESSSSGENSLSQSQQDLVFNPKDRNRSSSFPNRSSYIAMNDSNSSSSTGISILSQQSDLNATNSSLTSCGTVSTRASSNDCQVDMDNPTLGEHIHSEQDGGESEQSDNQEFKGNYENQSYFYAGPLEYEGSEMCKEKEREDCVDEKDNLGKMDENVSDTSSYPSKPMPDQHGGKVFTVLNVQGGNFEHNSNLCKTDDEKLIDLWHSTHSLSSDSSDKSSISELKSKMTLPLEELSPDEKANAIARHISSLPPFVPPKMKSYSGKLSPVLERTTPKKERPEPISSLTYQSDGVDEGKVDSPVLSPSLMKQQAKATLRITPPSEDENGKIWLPRSFVTEPPLEDNLADDKKVTTLVVDVGDLGEQTDSLSMSSLESSCYGEEIVRSSPAATILRPRSGKEYQKVERRRTMDDSSTTSPLTTPQSPATGSVFTFETSCTPSVTSGMSFYGELQSPKFSKLCQSEQTSICASSLRSESIQSPKVIYMNVDYNSPPDSPLLGLTSVPAEQVEPQLNYAEIDLSESGRAESAMQAAARKMNYAEMDLSSSERTLRQAKKGKKTPEPTPIEYSMIDMVATHAAQKARKEHAQHREGSLRRDRYSSLTNYSSNVNRSSSTRSGDSSSVSRSMSTRSERKLAATSKTHTVAQSSSSVDSSAT